MARSAGTVVSDRSRIRGVLLDLLMATMDSMRVWATAAGDRDRDRGLAWRDAVTARMIDAERYRAYRDLVSEAAREVGLDVEAPRRLLDAWREMERWPDADALERLAVPYGFVTNCSRDLASIAVQRSRLGPAFTLSAEEAGWYKPRREIYELACRRLGTAPAETLFIAGAAYDASGARAAGLVVRLITRRPVVRADARVAVVPGLTAALDGVP